MSVRAIGLGLWLGWMLAGTVIADEPADRAIAVITYNIRFDNPRDGADQWRHRKADVAEVISRGDVVGLQEVTAGQLTDLKELLKGFSHYGVGRDDGRRGGEYSPIFYRSDRFEAVDQG
ncbi:MAG: endonuclease/exonuclease/phosphatase family protein, partial [Pirellulales bacterium]|nr:endonuclease/exonuclease/phosphatase family protein [Pirellulales bacterium]